MLTVTFLSWSLGFLGVLLLPIDIAHVQNDGSPSNEIHSAWLWVYWITFGMGWVVCPLCADFCVAGDFTTNERIWTALKGNFRMLAFTVIGSVVVLFYLLVTGLVESYVGFAMAAANTYGLILIVALLGHGLVEVPRGLFRSSSPAWALPRLYFRAAELDSSLYDAMFELEDAQIEANQLADVVQERALTFPDEVGKFNMYVEVIQSTMKMFPLEIEESRSHAAGSAGVRLNWKDVTTAKFIACHARVREAQVCYWTRKAQWDELLEKVVLLEAVQQQTLSNPWCQTVPKPANFKAIRAHIQRLKDIAKWLWLTELRMAWQRGMAFLAGGMSVMILWSYCALAVGVNLSPLGLLLNVINDEYSLQIALLAPLLYMSYCMYRTLFKLKLFGKYTLQGPRLSPASALLFNAQQMIRLQFSLGYSFLLMLKYHKTTSLQLLMSNMTVVPIFGSSFNHYAPLIMVILCLFTLFNGFARVLKLLGIEHEDIANMDDPDSADKITEGRLLIMRKRATWWKKPEGRAGSESAVSAHESSNPSNSLLMFDANNFEASERTAKRAPSPKIPL